jgi:hypothetical protein
MSFENQIQQWVSLDNQLKQINDKAREIREKRSKLTENITKYAENNNLYTNTISISDGKLRFSNTKTPEPLTFKYLEKSLSEIIKNESQVKAIIEHLKQNREIKVIQEIKRVSNN